MEQRLREYMNAAFDVAMEGGALVVETDGVEGLRPQRVALVKALEVLAKTHGALIKDDAFIDMMAGKTRHTS